MSEGFPFGVFVGGVFVAVPVLFVSLFYPTVSKQELVDRGYAYYNPTNKEFTWKEEKE